MFPRRKESVVNNNAEEKLARKATCQKEVEQQEKQDLLLTPSE
jgi:hypothetical protein